MGVIATPTKTAGPGIRPGIGVEYEFTLLLDTTHTDGSQTIDLTAYFTYLHSCDLVGSLAATGYVVEIQKPAFDTALTSTNLLAFFYEAGADGAALDLLNGSDLSAVITGLTIVAVGKPALDTSWA